MRPTNRKSSSRQKSFFDQDIKARPHWQNNHRHYNATCQPEHSAQPAPVLPPTAASSEAKSKLAVFRFQQKNNDMSMPMSNIQAFEVMEDTKEVVRTDNDQENVNADLSISRHQSLSQQSLNHDLREFPQTPVGRIPLAELIAGAEDPHGQNLNLTPIERVIWKSQSVDKNDENGTSASKRGRKRAYSSSPASSSQNEVSGHFPRDKPSFDLQNLDKSLKTPQVDPANDLWTRYSSNTLDKLSPTETAKPAFSDFLNSSSPQTPAQPIKSRVKDGVQRSYSCSFEWPTSVAKRRKLQYSSSNQETSASLAVSMPKHDENGKSKMARVSLLVEEIQGRLAKPSASKEKGKKVPSGSAQLIHRKNISPTSPTRQCVKPTFSRTRNGGDTTSVRDKQLLITPKSSIGNLERQKSGSSFDFNDDELDVELTRVADEAWDEGSPAPFSATAPVLLHSSYRQSIETHEKLNASTLNSRTAHNVGKNPLKTLNSGKVNTSSSAPQVENNPLCFQPFKAMAVSKQDEFDVDDDVSAADLEDVMAIYDAKPLQDISSASRSESPNKQQLKSPSTRFASSNVQGAGCDGDKIQPEVVSDDEFGGDFDFERIIAQCEAIQKPQPDLRSNSPNDQKSLVIQRYLILTVAEGNYEDEKGYKQREKVLLVQSEKVKLNKVITLRNAWFETPCSAGSYVHLVGEFNQHGQCIVDRARNLLILHPDHLISATVVADSFSCTRRAVLQDRVKATSQLSEPTVYGSMLHEMFQEAMKANKWETKWLTAIIEKIATRFLESLYELNVTFENAVDHLLSKAMEIQSWAEVFVAAKPRADSIVKDRNGAQALMSINKLLDIEEKIWSPVYGLKGMVDATVQVAMKDGKNNRTLTVPFELKTGKFPNAAHKAQTALYTLLLSDRYDIEIVYGILYYTETSEISRIPAIRHELIHMVMQRNELASYVRQRLELPPMLKAPHLCGKCYAQTACFVYHKLAENGNEETSGMGDIFDSLVKHLNPRHQAFFRKWDDLITKEEKESMKFRRELWTMQSSEREKVGRCFANVIIDHAGTFELEDAPKINRFHYTFAKRKPAPGFSFTESQIVTGEPIVISDEKGHFALASGYVTNVQKQKIQVAVDRRLNNSRVQQRGFDAKHNQTFTGIMEIIGDGAEQTGQTIREPEETELYRIDKDEFSNGMATVRNNLICLMEKNVFGAQALRKLVVEGVPPTFKPSSTPYVLSHPSSQTKLNTDQMHAIEKVMSAKDYALVLGMPGTGKTTTIAHIIRALTAQGKSVLLTSYTHTAVDNILLKIRNDNIGVFRLGALAKIHPEVQEFADLAGVPMKTVEEIKKAYSRQVVATTCLGINHPVFNQKIFDYCIVDEASQITLPVCLGPIRMARTFILVGDHFQLPPLVQNKEALEGGLDVSLFKLLSESHASSVVNLEHQYRMCEDIMTLSNTLIYNGRLKCGTPEVASRTLAVPNIGALSQHHPSMEHLRSIGSKSKCLSSNRGSCWIRDLLDPSVKACFVNTDALLTTSRESESGSRIVNHCEATLCTQLVDSLITTGVPPADIGVITLYRSQLALLKQNLRHRHPTLEMHTADKFQGRDKEVIVLSLVRSNEARKVGDLLKDWRRVNVAFTRARTKLLIVGSKSTIVANDLLDKFVNLMNGKNWVYDLPKGAMDGHIWDETAAVMAATTTATQSSLGMGRSGSNGEILGWKKGVGGRGVAMLGKENAGARGGRKRPLKTGQLDVRAMLERKPILRDILNDGS